MTFFDWLVPKDERFFSSISDMMNCVNDSVNILTSIISDNMHKENYFGKIHEIEDLNEKKLQEVKELLEDAFITPIDPVEINEMINDIRSIIHLLVDTINHIYIFGSDDEYLEDIDKALNYLKSAVSDMQSSFELLKSDKKPKEILPYYVSVKDTEKEVYRLNADTTHKIYNENPLNIIKYGRIFDRICDLTSLCEDRTGAIYDIAVRRV